MFRVHSWIVSFHENHPRNASFEVSIVASDSPCKQNIFDSRSGPNVVHNERQSAGLKKLVAHNPNVIYSVPQVPRHNIAGQIIFFLRADTHGLSLSFEVGREI